MWQFFDLEEQYRRFPTIKRDEVQKLLEWLNGQPHLPQLTEQEVLLFYQACNHQMEYTKQVIDDSFTFRTHNEDFFGNVDTDSPQMLQAMETVAGFPLEKRSPEGCVVILGKLIDTDSSKFDFVGAMKLYCLGQDMWLLENGLTTGLTFVFDLTGYCFGHLARIGSNTDPPGQYTYCQCRNPDRNINGNVKSIIETGNQRSFPCPYITG
ncbi:uncharacterized protein LOC133336940 [Musca vetustissima]|uniref:uncharacterized protein LOC133336940 n=1 Tax=Musca vetustissima TaxID=27455 RepID=UPI002AB6454B|nr:uncharacterized protein LOC133336940 [Musca vetustissima]